MVSEKICQPANTGTGITNGGLIDNINQLNAKIDALTLEKHKEEEKKFKFPKKFTSKRKLKKNYACIIELLENGATDVYLSQINDAYVKLKDGKTFSTADPEYVIWFRNYPTLICPSWSQYPLNYKSISQDIKTAGMDTKAQKEFVRILKAAEEAQKTGSGKWLMWIVIGAIIIGLFYLVKTYLL